MSYGLDADNNCLICGTGTAGMYACKKCRDAKIKPVKPKKKKCPVCENAIGYRIMKSCTNPKCPHGNYAK